MGNFNWFSNVEKALPTWDKSHLVLIYNSFYNTVGFNFLIFCEDIAYILIKYISL